MSTEESMLKNEICEWLSVQPQCMFYVTQSVGISGRRNNSRYSCRGVADIVGIWNKRPLYIEVKTIKGKLEKHQSEFLRDVICYGGIAIVARSVNDVIRVLKKP